MKTHAVNIGPVKIGGGAPISIQSMCNTQTVDTKATLQQIAQLKRAGCDIVRLAIPDRTAAQALQIIIPQSPLPLIADIHFDHNLALAAIDAGIHGIRINPGNIGSHRKVKELAHAAGAANIPIRVGANAGSLAKKVRTLPMAQALVQSALEEIDTLEQVGFRQIKVSLKASELAVTIEANRRMAQKKAYPLHLGLTEAGTAFSGAIRSAAALAILLHENIGDTIRISLADDPVKEVKAAQILLLSLGLRNCGIDIKACPTCARTHGPVIATAQRMETALEGFSPCPARTIAIMGCEVNGPGEASHADLGLAYAPQGKAVLFQKGAIIKKGDATAMETLLLSLATDEYSEQ